MTQLLEINNLSLSFRKSKKQLLSGVNLTVLGGKTTVLLGESGAGKTMIVRSICNLLHGKNLVQSGQVLYQGNNLLDLSEKQRRVICPEIALIMQNPMTTFHPTRTIGRQLQDILALVKIPKSEVELLVLSAFSAMNLEGGSEILHCYPHQLSGGMLQRVAIALAMISRSKLLVADEPTTALDVVSQGRVLAEFDRLKSQGVGILLITHDLTVAEKCGDLLAIMKGGEIVEFGACATVLERPNHSYTQALLTESRLLRGGRP